MRLLIFILLLPLQGFAQSFKGGFIGGLNGSQVTGDQMSGFNQAGLYAGFTVARDIKEKFFVRLEMAYSGKGSRAVTDENNISLGMWKTARFHYVDMPLTLAYKPFKNQRLAITAGPALNYLFAGRIKDDLGNIVNATDVLKRFELAFSGGLLYHSKINMDFFARYSYSLTSLSQDNASIIFQYNSGFLNEMITLGFIKEF